MLRKLFFTTVYSTVLFFNLVAQEAAKESSKPKPVITGGLDAYYRFNFANSKTANNNLTSFTNSQNSFELGMATVKVEHTIGKVGMVADIGLGSRAEEFSYNDENSKLAIKQAYLTLNATDKIKLTAGSWATHVGYEMVDAFANKNYSMSYMFSYGPFFHTGIKAEATFGKSSLMIGIANPTDLKSASFSTKMLIGQYSIASNNDKSKLYLNIQKGKPNDSVRLQQADITATSTLSSKFSLGFNATIASFKGKEVSGKFGTSNEWWGAAAYVNYDVCSKLGLTLRSEYFNDDNQLNVFGSVTGAPKGGSIFANTFSGNYKIDNLTIIPEIRFDSATEAIFGTKTGTTSFLVALVYKF
jgi:hypothetical protein